MKNITGYTECTCNEHDTWKIGLFISTLLYYTFNLRVPNSAENAKLVKLKTNNASCVTSKEWKKVGTKTNTCFNCSNYVGHSLCTY